MTYQIADQRHPFMGLDNKICKNPTYWCRLHQVWLAEEDVKRKKCKCKDDFDLIGTHRCGNLEYKTIMKMLCAGKSAVVAHGAVKTQHGTERVNKARRIKEWIN